MGLEQVKKGLEKELEKKRSKILDEAEEEKKEILDEAKREAKAHADEVREKAEKEIESLKSSELASAKLEIKKNLLSEKKSIVDDVFQKAEEELGKLSKKERGNIISKLISRAEKEIEVGKVLCNPKDTSLVKGHKAEGDESILGGVVCTSKDGSCSVDLTLGTLLEEIREKNVKEVAQTLFG